MRVKRMIRKGMPRARPDGSIRVSRTNDSVCPEIMRKEARR